MILCAGENLIDMIQDPDPDPGATGAALRFRAVPGGSPFNCARAVARLGGRVGYLGPISTDPLGGMLAAALEGDGVALLGGRSDRPSGLALVTVTGGQPVYRFYREGVADRDITAEALCARLPAEAEVVHLGGMALVEGPDALALAALGGHAAARGLCLSVDPNIRPGLVAGDGAAYRARLHGLLSLADIVKLSDEDLAWLRPDTDPAADPEAAARALFDATRPALLVLTRGPRDLLALTGGARVRVPAAAVAALADTVGAGDTLAAALLQGLQAAQALDRPALAALPSERLTAILSRAARAAAITCSRPGCDPPRAAELDG